jgi:hypothetical protein
MTQIEPLIICWMYVWGAVATWSMCRYANLKEQGEAQPMAEMAIAMAWFVVVPVFTIRRAINFIVN